MPAKTDEKKIGGFADEVKGTFKNLKNLAETGETIITPEMREETKNTLKGLAEDAGEAASKEGGLFDQIKQFLNARIPIGSRSIFIFNFKFGKNNTL